MRISDDKQILCVFCFLDEFGDEIDSSDIAQRIISGFEFCGFVLADRLTSALTNCQGGFDKAFSYKDLNEFGIVSDYFKDKSIQNNSIACAFGSVYRPLFVLGAIFCPKAS